MTKMLAGRSLVDDAVAHIVHWLTQCIENHANAAEQDRDLDFSLSSKLIAASCNAYYEPRNAEKRYSHKIEANLDDYADLNRLARIFVAHVVGYTEEPMSFQKIWTLLRFIENFIYSRKIHIETIARQLDHYSLNIYLNRSSLDEYVTNFAREISALKPGQCIFKQSAFDGHAILYLLFRPTDLFIQGSPICFIECNSGYRAERNGTVFEEKTQPYSELRASVRCGRTFLRRRQMEEMIMPNIYTLNSHQTCSETEALSRLLGYWTLQYQNSLPKDSEAYQQSIEEPHWSIEHYHLASSLNHHPHFSTLRQILAVPAQAGVSCTTQSLLMGLRAMGALYLGPAVTTGKA
ncbi:MAG: hypothetical protein AAF355_03490 [Myxococcota bacterium]